MDCLICNTRSAVVTCVVCQMLLCEDCGIRCQKCGEYVCPKHAYRTHKGMLLCFPCQEKRKAQHAAKEHHELVEEDEGNMGVGGVMEGVGGEVEEERVLVASMRKPPPPWRLSLYTAGFSVLLLVVMLILPSLRRIPLPWGGHLATPYIFLIVPAVAIFWGVVGLVSKEKDLEENRNLCWVGVGISVVTAFLLVVTVFTDPARVAEQEALRTRQQRDQMSADELKVWRQQKMEKFRGEGNKKSK